MVTLIARFSPFDLMDSDYTEILQLNELWVKHKVMTKTDRTQFLGGLSYYPLVNFELSGQKFALFVDDEYEDLRYNYPLLNFCLVLRELEGYAYTSDYPVWCQERFLDVSDESIKLAFDNLAEVFQGVEKVLGKIDSFVSDYDFELNAGAAQRLRRGA